MTSYFDELIDFAIEQEQAAVDFYTHLAAEVTDAHVRETLLEFAAQERGHKARLLKVKETGSVSAQFPRVQDLKISDYLVDVDPTPSLTFQGALILAMKKEKAAYRMYTDLATSCLDPQLKKTFLLLAQEEANHKLAFEVEYDDVILLEN